MADVKPGIESRKYGTLYVQAVDEHGRSVSTMARTAVEPLVDATRVGTFLELQSAAARGTMFPPHPLGAVVIHPLQGLDPVLEQNLVELQKLLEQLPGTWAATNWGEGERKAWYIDTPDSGADIAVSGDEVQINHWCQDRAEAQCQFIARAHNHLPAILAELRRLQARG